MKKIKKYKNEKYIKKIKKYKNEKYIKIDLFFIFIYI
jgi:hypothetical protein